MQFLHKLAEFGNKAQELESKMQKKSLFCIFLNFFLHTDRFKQFAAVPLQRNKKNGRLLGKLVVIVALAVLAALGDLVGAQRI